MQDWSIFKQLAYIINWRIYEVRGMVGTTYGRVLAVVFCKCNYGTKLKNFCVFDGRKDGGYSPPSPPFKSATAYCADIKIIIKPICDCIE